jgi:hypothetical protein
MAIITGALVLALLILLGMVFVRADPRSLARVVPYVVGGVLLVAVALLTRFWPALLPLLVFPFLRNYLNTRTLPRGSWDPRSSPDPNASSDVRSIHFAMHLDHATGEMDGTVISGRFFSKKLSALTEAQLLELLEEVRGSEESRSLLEAYLDRRLPAWRDNVHEDRGRRSSGAPRAGGMTEEEAYEILGLSPGASESEIRAAHRRLMRGVHPDQGGSTVLAAKINEAKDRLLGGHR